ncbi:MAG: type IV-A pilus assembly ATPase PilB, partial [Methylophilaceae bacterium]
MVATATTTKLSGLARMLVQEKLLTEDEAGVIQSQANIQKTPFVTQVITSRKISAEKIAQTSSHAFGFPYLNLDAFNADYLPAKSIDLKLMQSNRVIALQNRNNVLFVAISDPTNLHALDSVQFQMGMTLSPVVVEDDKLGKWIDKVVESKDTSMTSLDTGDDFDLDMGDAEDQEVET